MRLPSEATAAPMRSLGALKRFKTASISAGSAHLQNPIHDRFRRRLEPLSLSIVPRTECLQFHLVQGTGVLRRANAACDAGKAARR